jgi:ribosome-binding factor A
MQENRRLRLQSAIQEELSMFVSREVKDPRIPYVTFTEIQVTQDGSHAIIFVSILGGSLEGRDRTPETSPDAADIRMKECIAGLTAASGFMRRHLGKVLNVRHIPTLSFREDRGFENAQKVHGLLLKLQDGGPVAQNEAKSAGSPDSENDDE